MSFASTVDDATSLLQLRTLPVLQALAAQVLLMISHIDLHREDDGELASSPAFHTCRNLFEQTRKVYSDSLLLRADDLGISLPQQTEVIALANRATLILDIFGAGEISPDELHDGLLENFPKRPSSAFLDVLVEIKTQLFLSCLLNNKEPQEHALHSLFVLSGEGILYCIEDNVAKTSLFDKCCARKEVLASTPHADRAALLARYPWSSLLQSITTFLRKDATAELLDIVDHDRYNGHPTQAHNDAQMHQPGRQLWTRAQEQTLLSALDEVKGPYWARILAMHGNQGSKSNILASKNQVQLKDKARNMKLSYLRARKEAPACLKVVSGQLTSRRTKNTQSRDGVDEQP